MAPTPQPRPGLSRRRFLGQLSAAGAVSLAPAALRATEPPARPLGFALAGLGNYSTHQLGPALRETKHARLVGVVTGSPAKGRQWARDYGFPATSVYGYDTMNRLADNPAVDVVYVVTPNALHAEHTIAAAQAGKHVICEKPMAVSVAECDAMLAACRAARVQLAIGYRLHYDPYHRELMRLARPEQWGPFPRMDGAFAFRLDHRPWRAIRRLSGGGPLMDLGVYLIQAGCMAADGATPLAVTAREEPKRRPDLFADVEETIAWTLEFPGGAVCTGRASYQDSANRFRAESDRGWIEFTSAFIYRGLAASTSRGALDFRHPEVNQQALQIDAFAEDVRAGRPGLVPGAMGRRDVAIIEAIYGSAAAGGARTPVRV